MTSRMCIIAFLNPILHLSEYEWVKGIFDHRMDNEAICHDTVCIKKVS